MYHTLEEGILQIRNDTEKYISGNPQPSEKEKKSHAGGVRILTEADLDIMIPSHCRSIRINAHLSCFDDLGTRHRHTFYELVYVYSGSLKMIIHEKLFLFSAGDIILLNPNVIHAVALNRPDSQVINILLKRSLLNQSFFHMALDSPMFSEFNLPSIDKGKNNPNYMIYQEKDYSAPAVSGYLLQVLNEYLNYRPMSEQAIELNLTGLFIELARSRTDQKKKAEEERIPAPLSKGSISIADICQFVAGNHFSVGLEETAAHYNYNSRYFSQLLKNITGKSFSEFRTDLRMQKSLLLLKETNLTVSDIISEIGYENASHFYRTFEDFYHAKPSDYR